MILTSIPILGLNDVYTFLAALLAIYAAYYCLIWPQISPLRAFPGPNYRLPFFGSLEVLKILFNKTGYQSAQKAHEKYGPFSRRFVLGGREVLFVTGASELATILHSLGKSFDRSETQSKILTSIIGNGLASSRGSEHDTMRRLLNPSFNTNTIKRFIPKFALHANELHDYWTENLQKNSVKEDHVELCIQDSVAQMTLNVIMDCAFGYKSSSGIGFESPVNKAINILIRTNLISIETIYPLLKYLPLKINRTRKESRILVEETIKKVINLKKEKQKNDLEVEMGSLDLLDRLLVVKDDDGSALSDKELFDHIITFMFAGYETTSTSLAWVLLNLAQNPEIQQRLREEILSICPDSSSDITWEQLEKMSYLNSVIMESLRRNPTIPGFQKVSLEDVVVGNYVIPANTICVMLPGVAQNSKKYWSEPEKFNPDQFLNSNDNNKVAGSCLPFGSGRTMCIGKKFALTEMKVFLITIIRDLAFSTVPGLEFETKLVITTFTSPLLKLRVQKYNEKN